MIFSRWCIRFPCHCRSSAPFHSVMAFIHLYTSSPCAFVWQVIWTLVHARMKRPHMLLHFMTVFVLDNPHIDEQVPHACTMFPLLSFATWHKKRDCLDTSGLRPLYQLQAEAMYYLTVFEASLHWIISLRCNKALPRLFARCICSEVDPSRTPT